MQSASFRHSVETPAFVYDEAEVSRALDVADGIRKATGCRILYSVKPLTLAPLLEFMAPRLDGFAVSSPFEARLARSHLADGGLIHFTSPGIRPGEVRELDELCDYIAFNSLSQWRRFGAEFGGDVRLGLRVNPGLSFLEDERYDPCREYSKLGAPLSDLCLLAADNSGLPGGLTGILVHSNCESNDFRELERTVDRLAYAIPGMLRCADWINLGGGYMFNEKANLEPLYRVIDRLRREYGLEVFLEPGAAFVRAAGYIVATVLDIFASGGKEIAVLDTTVNHMPELLEFDFEPDVVEHREGGRCEYILAGCTCLAGDVFGEYSFDRPLAEGDRVTFCNAGSYSLTKAHMFNGVNLPNIYAVTCEGELRPVKKYGFEDYASRWSVHAGSPV